MDALLGVPDGDRVRVVLVLRLPDEREPAPRREPVILQRVGPVRRPRELHDTHARIVPLHRIPGRGVTQPIARLAGFEPDPQAPTAAFGGGVFSPGAGGFAVGASSILRTRGA